MVGNAISRTQHTHSLEVYGVFGVPVVARGGLEESVQLLAA
jgi:hypothetical protein